MYKLLIISTFLLSSLMFGQEHIEAILRNHLNQILTIECRYKQEKKISMIKSPLVSTGIFKYKKEGDIILEQKTPFKETYQITKDSKTQFDKYISLFLISILNGEILNNKNLNLVYSQNKSQYTVRITPKKNIMKERVNEVKLYFSKETISLNKLEVIFKNNDVTTINLYED